MRHCATRGKVLGAIPDGVVDFILPALGSTQLLTEINTMDISWGVKAENV